MGVSRDDQITATTLCPADQGGTAAVVEAARARRLPVEIIWPAGA
jgi:hypothetical protein